MTIPNINNGKSAKHNGKYKMEIEMKNEKRKTKNEK